MVAENFEKIKRDDRLRFETEISLLKAAVRKFCFSGLLICILKNL